MIEFQTTQYEFSHGKKPRGFGTWAFQITGQIFYATASYGEAKRQAAEKARAAGVSRVRVLP